MTTTDLPLQTTTKRGIRPEVPGREPDHKSARRVILTVASLAAALLALAGEAAADQIALKNGDRLTGRIVKSDGKTIVFKSEMVGELGIPFENIESVTGDQPLYVGLADGRTVMGVVSATASQTEIKSATGEVVRVERSAIKTLRSEAEQKDYESTLHPGWLQGWTGGADFGVALTRGNSDTTNIALGLAMSRETLRDKTSIYAASIYSRDKTEGVSRTVANTIRFGGRYDRDFTPKLFGYGFTDLEHNGLQDLDLRWVLGGGLGYHAIRNERLSFDLLGGLAMNRENFEGDEDDRTSLEAQAGQTLSWKLNSRVSLKEQLFFFPNLSDGGEYRIAFDAGMTMDITKRIGWQITLSDRFLSNPPVGFRQNDLLLTTGVKLKLGTVK
jgi:putative salt-induced outer membrane protein YdiY